MGLITKTIRVKWRKNNREWYESKGYVFTKPGDDFECKVKDLQKGSHSCIKIKCDEENCNSILDVEWKTYLKNVGENDKYYCNKCANNLFSKKDKTRQTRLRNSKSFEQWCCDNLSKEKADEILLRWDYDKNVDKDGSIIKPNSITFSSTGFNKKGYWFKCLKHPEHESELKDIHTFTKRADNNSLICNQCNSLAQWGIDNICPDFLEKYWDYSKNMFDPWEISYGSHAKIWIKCQSVNYHESSDFECKSFTLDNQRCQYCSGKKVHTLDSLGKILEDSNLLWIWSEKNGKSPYAYTPYTKQEIWWKCLDEKHDNFKRSICNSNMAAFKCPECSNERKESILQEKVRIYLEDLGYNVLHENKCNIKAINPKTKHSMLYDNEVKVLNLIIEVNGKQHYQICGFHYTQSKHNNTSLEYELYMQQVRDRYKKFIAYKRGYNYITIPYWTDDKEKNWKNLINNKIKKIKNKTI